MNDREELYKNLNEGMLNERFYAFRSNLKKNLPLIKKHGGLRPVVGMLKDKNIIVIGAGPSIENAFEYLKELSKDKSIVLMSTDMALRPLLMRGIVPSFVITCETTPRPFFVSLKNKGPALLSFSCSSNANLRSWAGKIYFYNWMIKSDLYNSLWKMAGEDLGFVATGSVVTSQAVSIALGCGIRSLLMAGNDLAFKDKFYACGTLADLSRSCASNRLSTEESIEFGRIMGSREYELRRGGRVYYTNHQFLAAKYWLEDLFSKTTIPIYDASEPGCAGKNIKNMNLEDYHKILK